MIMIVVSTYNSENSVTNEFNCSYNINRIDQIISNHTQIQMLTRETTFVKASTMDGQ